MPFVAGAYDLDPKLAGQLFPLYSETQLMTATSASGGHAESTWTHPVQLAMYKMGSVTAYGKWSMDTDVWFGEFLPSLVDDEGDTHMTNWTNKWRAQGRNVTSGRRGAGPLNRAAEDSIQGQGVISDDGNIGYASYMEMIQDKTRARKAHKVPEYNMVQTLSELYMDEEALRFFLSPAPVHKKLTSLACRISSCVNCRAL